MARTGEDDGARAGNNLSPKRQRLPCPDEDEDEEDDADFEPACITEDEDDDDDDEELEDIEEEEVEEVVKDAQSGSQSSSSSSQSVKLQSSDVLDCPTCFEPLNKPIYQCTNGHLACSSCCKRLNKRCSFCRSHIGDIRCRAMEKVIEASIVPCRNAKYGCKETTTYCKQSSHEKVCFFAECSCPVPNCNYIGSYMNLKAHACAVHSWGDEGGLHPVKLDCPILFCMNLRKLKTVVLKEEKEGDLIVLQAFEGSKGVNVTVNRIAPLAPAIPNLSCSLARLDQFRTVRIGTIMQKIQKVREQIHPEDDVLSIPLKMMAGLEHCWKIQICIGNGYKYTHI
ncbi:E3 ubiquitin-protein ligase SINA-like 5 isoform X1 [Capsella rubella]|nr:E3 ubiquitin-protein ligase SINA-like 5 isoform X1 [Capsella rubella]